jgi:hypothetical protein
VHLHGGPAPVHRFLPQLIDLIWNRRIDPGKVFDLTLRLEQAAEGYKAMDDKSRSVTGFTTGGGRWDSPEAGVAIKVARVQRTSRSPTAGGAQRPQRPRSRLTRSHLHPTYRASPPSPSESQGIHDSRLRGYTSTDPIQRPAHHGMRQRGNSGGVSRSGNLDCSSSHGWAGAAKRSKGVPARWARPISIDRVWSSVRPDSSAGE